MKPQSKIINLFMYIFHTNKHSHIQIISNAQTDGIAAQVDAPEQYIGPNATQKRGNECTVKNKSNHCLCGL